MKQITIKLPLTRTEREDVFVGLNGRTFLIRRGVPVKVPAGVAKILEHRERMLSIAMDFETRAARPLEELGRK